MPRDNEPAFLAHILQNNEPAIKFCQALFRISQTWDDLIDDDKPISTEQVNDMMWDALIGIPMNSFYQANFSQLQPVLQDAILAWETANTLEKSSDDHKQNMAFVLRDRVGSVITHCALLLYGVAYARQVGPMVLEHIFEQELADYKKELVINKVGVIG